jgi:hypothetical protein
MVESSKFHKLQLPALLRYFYSRHLALFLFYLRLSLNVEELFLDNVQAVK